MAHRSGDGPAAVYWLAFAPRRARLQRDGTDEAASLEDVRRTHMRLVEDMDGHLLGATG